MATKKDAAALRGAKLIKKTLESARQSILTSPEPAVGAKKLVLPNGEPISPAMKELLAFAEAYEMFGDDCVSFQAEVAIPACLYVGTADDAGEYPVLQFSWEDGVAKIGGFIPFDVWVAQQLGGLERGKGIGEVPEAYAALIQPSADTNGDGRISFTPKAGEAGAGDDGDDEDDDDDKDA